MEKIYKKESPRLFNQITGVMTFIEGQNNYEQNVLFVEIYPNYIRVESACCNQYGGLYGNNDLQTVSRSDLPNFAEKKLYGKHA